MNNLFIELRESIFLLFANILPRLSIFDKYRYILIRFANVDILGKCTIWSGFDLRPIGTAYKLTISKGVFINRNFRCAMPIDARVFIGKNTLIGPNVMIETANHTLRVNKKGLRSTNASSIHIGKHVWIGAACTILGGVTIGDNSVVAAGSVVTKDIEPFSLVGGIPAKLIKNLKEVQ